MVRRARDSFGQWHVGIWLFELQTHLGRRALAIAERQTEVNEYALGIFVEQPAARDGEPEFNRNMLTGCGPDQNSRGTGQGSQEIDAIRTVRQRTFLVALSVSQSSPVSGNRISEQEISDRRAGARPLYLFDNLDFAHCASNHSPVPGSSRRSVSEKGPDRRSQETSAIRVPNLDVRFRHRSAGLPHAVSDLSSRRISARTANQHQPKNAHG